MGRYSRLGHLAPQVLYPSVGPSPSHHHRPQSEPATLSADSPGPETGREVPFRNDQRFRGGWCKEETGCGVGNRTRRHGALSQPPVSILFTSETEQRTVELGGVDRCNRSDDKTLTWSTGEREYIGVRRGRRVLGAHVPVGNEKVRRPVLGGRYP